MDKLFDRNRFPDGLKIIPLCVYIPVGIVLGFVRFFIGLQTLFASVILQKMNVIRSILVRGMCFTLGLLVQEENSFERDHSVPVIVSNHVSIVDHIAINLVTGSAAASPQKAPILIQQVFNFGNLEKSRVLGSGEIVDMQPEGAITNGRHGLLKFKTIPSSITDTVQPACLKLWRPPLTDVSVNTLSATWLQDLLWFLIVPLTIIKIKYLPAVKKAEGETDVEWTIRVEEIIAEELGVPVTEHTAASRFELERKLLPLDVQLRNYGPAYVASSLKERYPSLPLEIIRAEIERTKNLYVAIRNLDRLRADNSLGAGYHGGAGEIRKSDLDIAPPVFSRSSQDRMASFQEKKQRLIETARRRYIEKHALNSL